MVDASDLKSLELDSCGFKSRRPHHPFKAVVRHANTDLVEMQSLYNQIVTRFHGVSNSSLGRSKTDLKRKNSDLEFSDASSKV